MSFLHCASVLQCGTSLFFELVIHKAQSQKLYSYSPGRISLLPFVFLTSQISFDFTPCVNENRKF